MDWIFGRLACGSTEDAELITPSGMTAIMTLCEVPMANRHRLIHYAHLPIPDEVWLPPDVWKERVGELAHLLGVCRLTVLVHCRLGVSRAPALCAAYLMHCGMAPDEARDYVQARRPVVNIHPETWRGVLEWWEHS